MQLAGTTALELRRPNPTSSSGLYPSTISALQEVLPEDADRSVASLYADIRQTLRAPFVSRLFRMLAQQPEVLVPAWHTTRPALRFEPFADAAEDLRRLARIDLLRDALVPATWSDWPGATSLRPLSVAVHHMLPKLLIVATAWHMGRLEPSTGATSGALLDLGTEDDASLLPCDTPDPAVDDTLAQIREAQGEDVATSYLRMLGHCPALLQAAWKTIAPHLETSAWQRQRQQVIACAERHVERLFEPADIPELFGGRQVELLQRFRTQVLPDLLLGVFVVRAWLEGTSDLDA